MSRIRLAISMAILASFSSPSVQACTECSRVTAYGNDVVDRTQTADGEVNSASEAIRLGFDNLVVTIDTVFANLVKTVRGMSGDITSELKRGTTVNTKLMDEYNRQEEARVRQKYMLDAKQYLEEHYGEGNIPLSTCVDFTTALSLKEAKEEVKPELSSAVTEYFNSYRTAAPVDDWRYQVRTLNFAETQDLSMSQDVLEPEQVEIALEWVNQTLEPVPVTPIRKDLVPEELSADQRTLHARMQSHNLRLDAAKESVKEEILLKSPILGDGNSIQGVLADRAFKGFDQEQIVDLSTGSSSLILREMLRDMQYGMAIDFETFKTQLSRTRMSAIALASSMDERSKQFRVLEKTLDGLEAIND